MSTVWYTSDLHFGHKKVSEIRGFETPDAHDLAITEEWRRVVTKKDIVHVLGDLTLGPSARALQIIRELPGTKHFIAGNHDEVHPAHKTATSRIVTENWYRSFASVHPFLKKTLNHMPVLLSHFPYSDWGDGESREGSRYDQYRLPDKGLPLLHGHTHGREQAHTGWSGEAHMLHVGWDAWGTLVPQETVVEWLMSIQGGNR